MSGSPALVAAVSCARRCAWPQADANAHLNMGVLLARRGRYGEAAFEFSQALSIDPANEEARANLDRARALHEAARPR